MLVRRAASALVLISGFGVFLLTSRIAEACGSDVDCKGDRVCENGQCVAPGSVSSAVPPASPTSESESPPAPPPETEPPPAPRPPLPEPEPAPPEPQPVDQGLDDKSSTPSGSGIHVHDGFYLRLAIGLGYMYGNTKVEAGSYDGEFNITGIGVAEELSFGGNVAPGLVLGGGIFAAGFPSAKGKDVKFDGDTVNGEFEWDMLTVGLVGPFIDYYFDPTEGMHFQAAVGISTLQTSDGTFGEISTDGESGTGIGAMVGFGWESWVGEQWSIGGLLRLMMVKATIESSLPGGSDADYKPFGVVPSVLFTATYH